MQPGSAAEEAGIVAGDVVVELNGTAIANRDAFVAAVDKVAAGKLLKMLVLRQGTTTFVALPKP